METSQPKENTLEEKAKAGRMSLKEAIPLVAIEALYVFGATQGIMELGDKYPRVAGAIAPLYMMGAVAGAIGIRIGYEKILENISRFLMLNERLPTDILNKK
jgi:hypothetical protein